MEKIQSFIGGMNSDVSPTQQPESTYVEAINIEIIDDELQGSVAISNSKGNKFQVTIPDVDNIIKLTYDGGGSTDITIRVDGIDYTSATVTISSMQDLYDLILSDATIAPILSTFSIFYTDLTIVIYPKSGYTVVLPFPVAGTLVYGLFIPASVDLKPIGYGVIRDDIYIFSTPSNDIDPQTNGGGYGYIWKLTYDNITFASADASLELIYANDLNFTTYFHIPPTAVVGRYENDNTKRLYWTDNYNRLRSLNVADPQLGALDLSLVDVQPSINFDIPLMTDIRSASGTTPIPIGVYQLAYKLSNTGGSSTVFSVPSNPIYLVSGDLTSGINAAEENQAAGLLWEDYRGAPYGTTTTKRITWTINNLDRDFTRVEAVLLVRERKDDPATIYSIFEGPIQNNSIDIVVDGDVINGDDTTIVTLDEFLTLSSVFTHCKTINTKDNRLVVGNVRNELTELNYDARAYRFTSGTNNTRLVDAGVATTYAITAVPADWSLIDEESDAIAVANIESTDLGNYSNLFRCKRGSAVIGGTGPNISYEFVSIAVACDKTVEPLGTQPLPIVSTNPDNTAAQYDLGVYSVDRNGSDILQEYPINFPSSGNINDGMKYPQASSIFVGYQHNEVYRMGIQFYDKAKNPYFVKWIGDIKFPDYFDVCPATNNIYADGALTGLTDYRKSFTGVHGINEAFVCQLGIKMEVNIPADLTDKISGYSIVRVKREETDKRVVAEGIISNTFLNLSGTNFYLGFDELDYDDASTDKSALTFLTPNILDANLTIPTTSMKLRASSYLFPANTAPYRYEIVGGITSTQECMLLKMYDHTDLGSSFERDIEHCSLQDLNESVTVAGNTYINYASFPDKKANGNPSYLMIIDSDLPAGVSGHEKFLVYIYNPIINQYGGYTYADRSNSNYIICSHFRSVATNVNPYADTFYVFGGDVTNDIMDEERISVDWGWQIAHSVFPDELTSHNTTTFFYPSSSPVNRALRYGRHANTNLTDTVDVVNDERTDYFYNKMYSAENDIVTFFPKPDPFISTIIYDNRFYISDIKINGELTDSWSVFAANNYWDVEGVYGPINSMLPLADKMYFWQDRAFGIIEINPRTLITDSGSSANSQVQTGTGLPLQRHDYISTVNGTKHQGSTISSSNALYWYDANLLKIHRYSGQGNEPLSDVKGLFSYLSKNLKGEIQNVDKPVFPGSFGTTLGVNGVTATFDNKKHRAIFTFHSSVDSGEESFTQKSFTVCLNELKNSFTTFYSFTPRIYVNDNKYILSFDARTSANLNKCYLHDIGNYGEFYGQVYDSHLKFIVNPNPQYTKVFDNLVYDSQATVYDTTTNRYINYNDDTWSRIRITNDYQNTDIQTLTPNSNLERKERSWQLQVPRNRVLYTTSNSPNIYVDLSATEKDFGERLRDKYIQIELWYSNLTNRELKTNNLTTVFRQSIR